MSADENDLKRRMDGAIEALKREFAGLRTGRASTSLLDNVQVDAYGSNMPSGFQVCRIICLTDELVVRNCIS